MTDYSIIYWSLGTLRRFDTFSTFVHALALLHAFALMCALALMHAFALMRALALICELALMRLSLLHNVEPFT